MPGCKNATFLDLHHIVPRAEGGSNDPENLRTMCGAHHRAVHRGALIIWRGPSGLLFRHADGRPYGDVGPMPLDIERKVASALRNLGFRDADVRTVLAELRGSAPAGGTPPLTTERLLREALIRLGPRPGARR